MPEQYAINELRPCPFCRSQNAGATTDFDQGRYWRGHCGKCGALGPRAKTAAKAIDNWNRRAPAQGVPVEVREDIRAALVFYLAQSPLPAPAMYNALVWLDAQPQPGQEDDDGIV